MSARLVLHWPLDAVAEGRVADLAEGQYGGDVKGDPQTDHDVRFGSCLRFDGSDDHLLLQNVPADRLRAYTFQTWIKPLPGARPATVVLCARNAGTLQVLLEPNGAITHRFMVTRPLSGLFEARLATAPETVPAGLWTHVAVTNDGRTARIHLNGIQASELAFAGTRTPDPSALTVCGVGPGRFFAGSLAHLRIYDDALTPVEVKRDMAEDEAALAAFVRSHPLDFALVNDDDHPVLYIDEAATTQAMTLRLTNTSRYPVEPVPLTVPVPTTAEYHCALRLRPGTLAAGIAPRAASAAWALAAEPDGTALYLQWKSPATLAPGASTTVRIEGLNADGAGGTRGTRVELEYLRWRHPGEQDELTGTRLQFLDLVNHRGRRDLPLDLRLVGGDRVLADSQAVSALRVHLTHTLLDGPGLSLRKDSELLLSFDVQQPGQDRPWALTASGDAPRASLTTADPRWRITAEALGQRMRWTLRPREDLVLAPGEHLELALGGIVALPSLGHAPILVDYQDVPGYANGTLTVPVERTPLLFSGANVGIGTQRPEPFRLAVNGVENHLQLRRDAALGGGGKVLFLELFQDTSAGPAVTFPSIRFHHGEKFWHRIEGRPEGIQFKQGHLGGDALIDIHAGTAVVAGLRIGGTTIGEAELRVLKKLAAGQLEFDLFNVKQGEYIYAADLNPLDADRRHVYTWRRRDRLDQGRWRLHFPG
ncbi:concanavalin A-like lectin/glucanase superfamily protein [Actinocorallia herbida]|uniref:Concanavalin A-like lectin/glucanase superfamily protein n=1 Tax=Actinocorallia herbida TaxID=58109 RepID=A0A3N1CXU2_9ACTN|nr:LamG domain-containing protein [Actinocorallia herbida]ROO86107.1 concanavalin A-like lectin/glucanase superfamily protein [Actinocorallia herbida]